MRSVGNASEYRGFDFFCNDDPIDSLYLVMDVDRWSCKMKFEGRERHYLRSPLFVGWRRFEAFALPPGKQKKTIYTPVPHSGNHKSNRPLGVQSPAIFSYFVDHLRVSGMVVREKL